MADFKGFGAKPPELSPITLAEVNDAEMDRAMRFFLRQGCTTERALNLVAASVMFHMAEADGMVPGVDFKYDPGRGGIFSNRMSVWLKENTDPQGYQHMVMEGFIQEGQS